MWLLILAIFSLVGFLVIFLRKFFLTRHVKVNDIRILKTKKTRLITKKKRGSFKNSIKNFSLKIFKFFLVILSGLISFIFRIIKLGLNFLFKGLKNFYLKILEKAKKRKTHLEEEAIAEEDIQKAESQKKKKRGRLFTKVRILKKRSNALKKEKKQGSVLLKKAEIFFNLKDYYTAEKYALQAITEQPKDKKNYVFLSRLYLDQNNFADAGQCLEQAAKLGEKDIEVWLLGADAFLRWHKQDKCYKMFQGALKLTKNKKDKARVFFSWGKACKEFSDQKKARDLFRKAIEMDKMSDKYRRALDDVVQ